MRTCGEIIIVAYGNHRIRSIDPNSKVITTLVGTLSRAAACNRHHHKREDNAASNEVANDSDRMNPSLHSKKPISRQRLHSIPCDFV